MTSIIHRQVVANGHCIGCGACAHVEPGVNGMQLDAHGRYVPQWHTPPATTPLADVVCPFSNSARDEDAIGRSLYGNGTEKACQNHDRRLGFYQQVWVGHAADEGNFRMAGSSGGLTNWLLAELLRTGTVDAVIGVGELDSEPGGTLFGYQRIERAEDLHRLAKSKYYPITLDQVLGEVAASDQRHAFVGVPCFVKTMRLLCEQDAQLARRVPVCLSVVCGHLKSTAFAQSLGWQLGVAPERLSGFDFRVKIEDEPANRYGVEARSPETRQRAQVFDLQGTDWGLGYFKYKACDYCDDIAGETADVTLGDAWLPDVSGDWRGHNIVIVRDPTIETLLQQANEERRISLRHATADDFVQSQAANYRHRHDGLAYRLHRDDAIGAWRPNKRITPSITGLTPARQRALDMRCRLRDLSHNAFAQARRSGYRADFSRRMRGSVLAYHFHARTLTKHLIKQSLIMLRRFIRFRI